MRYAYGNTSQQRRIGIHPDLIAVDDLSMSYQILDQTILHNGGVRTPAIQRGLVESGASKTMRSRHLVQPDGYGHAIDKAPYPIDWDDIQRFIIQAHTMRYASIELGVSLTWGAVWDRRLHELDGNLEAEVDAYVARRKAKGKKAFLDYPHFQYEGKI